MARTANQSPEDKPKQITNSIKIDYHLASLTYAISLPRLDDDYSERFRRYAIAHNVRMLKDLKSKALPAKIEQLEQVAIDTLTEHGHVSTGYKKELKYQAGVEG